MSRLSTDYTKLPLLPRNIYRGGVYSLEGYGLLSDAFREILPLLVRHVLPRAFSTGLSLAEEVGSGTPFKEAVKRRAKRTFERVKEGVIKRLRGGGTYKKRVKRRRGPSRS